MRKTGFLGLAMLALAAVLGVAPSADARGATETHQLRTHQAEPARRAGMAVKTRRQAAARPMPRADARSGTHARVQSHAGTAKTSRTAARQRARPVQALRAGTRQAQLRQTSRRQVQRGRASYYASRFHGQRMANGRRFDRHSNSAASRTLPLGTRAQVRNLDNGRTATVVIDDRGPHARSRVLDVSPAVASRLGMRESGTARVEIVPQLVPTAQAARRNPG